ncbi:hypothetical protein FBQ74_17070 [Salinimonas iocasae]|uniref:Uncharacterized protein n=2 Tax=Salinimonas iocasae TaxID=2572577 RepID=A0A5B7YIB8_9ALTE|nr:hypothetical protein FBQ74_17070 [Salinimonas iocasae]
MNITISYPQPSKSRIWLPPACYLLAALSIQVLIMLFHNQIFRDSTMNLGTLRDPVVLMLATSLLWISLRIILRRQHSFLMHHLLHQNKLCELRYFRRKSVNRLRNQLFIAAIASFTVLVANNENAMLAPYPNETSFTVITFLLLMVSGVFLYQCATLPYFLRKQFLPVKIDNPAALKTSHQLHLISQLIILQVSFSLCLWQVVSAAIPALRWVALAFSALTLLIAIALIYQSAVEVKRARIYCESALQSNARKLHFLRNKGQYPEQALQLAIKKLLQQRSDLKAHRFSLTTSFQRYLIAGAFILLTVIWLLAG